VHPLTILSYRLYDDDYYYYYSKTATYLFTTIARRIRKAPPDYHGGVALSSSPWELLARNTTTTTTTTTAVAEAVVWRVANIYYNYTVLHAVILQLVVGILSGGLMRWNNDRARSAHTALGQQLTVQYCMLLYTITRLLAILILPTIFYTHIHTLTREWVIRISNILTRRVTFWPMSK